MGKRKVVKKLKLSKNDKSLMSVKYTVNISAYEKYIKKYPITINKYGNIDIDKTILVKYYKEELNLGFMKICESEYYIKSKFHDKSNKYYQNVKSRKQINAIVSSSKKRSGIMEYSRLMQLFAAKLDVINFINFINSFVSIFISGTYCADDLYVYNALRLFQRSEHKLGVKIKKKEIMDVKYRHKNVKDLKKLVCWDRDIRISFQINHTMGKIIKRDTHPIKLDKYIDIGCGDCTMAIVLGEIFDIPNKKIYGVDIKSWSSYHEKKRLNLPINITTYKKGEKITV